MLVLAEAGRNSGRCIFGKRPENVKLRWVKIVSPTDRAAGRAILPEFIRDIDRSAGKSSLSSPVNATLDRRRE